MNTNDLPPAARLAALIEAGRAANPDLKQGRGTLFNPDKGEACAIGFAKLACGVPRDTKAMQRDSMHALFSVPFTICHEVVIANDRGQTIAEICTSLREGELARVPA